MQIDFMRIPSSEAERLCHAEGFENAAKLFARIVDLEALNLKLTQENEILRDQLADMERLTP
jgi:hypothetical protein